MDDALGSIVIFVLILMIGAFVLSYAIFGLMLLVVCFGLPLLLFMGIGLISIPFMRIRLLKLDRVAGYLEMLPEGHEESWMVDGDRLEKRTSVQWLYVLGVIATMASTAILFQVYKTDQDLGWLFGLVGVVGVPASLYTTVVYPAWVQRRLCRSVQDSLKRGIGDIRYVLDLKRCSRDIRAVFEEGFGITAPEDRVEQRFTQIASQSPGTALSRVEEALTGERERLDQLQNALSHHQTVVEEYTETAREVNQTGMGSLLVEMNTLYDGIHSEGLADLLRNDQWEEYHTILSEMQDDLERISQTSSSPGCKNRNRTDVDQALAFLGLKMDDTSSTIKARYHALAARVHSDKLQKDKVSEAQAFQLEEYLKELNAAVAVLKKNGLA